LKILITGATGLVGKEIVKLCHAQGIVVHYLTTSKSKIKTEENYKGFYWNLEESVIDKDCFINVDVIINLAGASISKRWTTAYKKEILNSRIQALKILKSGLLSQIHQIKQIISASAIGVYQDSLTCYYDETTTDLSNSFLGDVVQQWEKEADTFFALGINVAKVRIGLVLATLEGALPKIVKPIKFGLGVSFGSGKQWQSWIHISDLAAMFLHIMLYNLKGTYNAVAPNPVTNKEFTKTVAKTIKMPLIFTNIPKDMMKLVLGDMHTLLFESQRVSPKKIEKLGFQFKYHTLQMALRDLL
jgi:uncharacterized protein (TIGR01777 family)